MTYLDEILAWKREEVASAIRKIPLTEVRAAAESMPPPRDFGAVLVRRGEQPALIAEIKRASPSCGDILPQADPTSLARIYVREGAAALSVLTDSRFFKGDIAHLRAVREACPETPVLRKDFIVHPYQVYEARAAGADAVLLIIAALEPAAAADLLALATELRMTALVEVHQEAELEQALGLGARLIGVNHRDLRTLRIDRDISARLRPLIPSGIRTVAESGLRTPQDVRAMGALGYDAVLIGEALMEAGLAQEGVNLDAVARRVRSMAGTEGVCS